MDIKTESPHDDQAAEIARLQRRLERERNIRIEAEAIAERNLRALYTKQEELRLLQKIAFAANEAEDVNCAMQTALQLICEYTEWPVGHVYMASHQDKFLTPSVLWHVAVPEGFTSFQTFTEHTSLISGQGLPGRVLLSGKAEWIVDVTLDGNFPRAAAASAIGIRSGFAFPVLRGHEVIAVLEFYTQKQYERDESLIEITTHIATQLSRVIERCFAQEQNRLQMDRLSALHAIDVAITQGQDLSKTLTVCLQQTSSLLDARATSVTQFDRHSGTLRRVAQYPFSRIGLNEPLDLQESPAWQVISNRQIVYVEQPNAPSPTTSAFNNGRLREYFGVPLVSKGEIKGVLEIFNCQAERCDAASIAFLETLAGQIALAIDNAQLLESLELSNIELMVAYEATIEGWSHALDLRDEETEGHSRRVTEMTVALAEAVGYDPAGMVALRRGALLHDIGKMGIPDGILLKPGPLTAEEWVIMRRHPEYANTLLNPIEFLQPALDIPYCHHEKWDGNGYPRGLKGEEIPLAARLFAVVDVWDALRSNRPYRQGWPYEKVLQHIQSLSGSHFDPDVVEAFLQLMAERETPMQLQRAA